MNKKIFSKIAIPIFLVLVLTFFCVFFTKIHPIIVFDADDWNFISIRRIAYPIWGGWNPVKVLPETLMPLFGFLSAILHKVFNVKYTYSNTIIIALVVSIFITIYVYCFIRLINKKFKLTTYTNIFITILFILFHFLIFRYKDNNNLYMFWTWDATCYYHYIIPALLNCSLVMYFMSDDFFKKKVKINNLKVSILVLLVYFAIFSNVYHSIILVIYIASILFWKFINLLKQREFDFKGFLESNLPAIIIILIWFISLVFEINGGRSNNLSENSLFINEFCNTIKEVIGVFLKFNKSFLLISTILLLYVFIIYFSKRKQNKNFVYYIYTFSFCISFTLIYLVLVSSKAGSGYISRPDVLYGVVFYIFIGLFLSLGHAIKIYSRVIFALPVITYIIIFQINTPDRTFRESNINNYDPHLCIQFTDKIIDEIILANLEGKDEITIKIPKFPTNDNWPMPEVYSVNLARTLYKHGIINRKIKINLELSNELIDLLQ